MSNGLRFVLEAWIALGLALTAIWLGVLAVVKALMPPQPDQPPPIARSPSGLDRTLTGPTPDPRQATEASNSMTTNPRSTMPDNPRTTTRQTWDPYPSSDVETTPPTHEQSHAGHQDGHSAHTWMMLLMCLPLVAIGLWLLGTGRGVGPLLAGLACMGMMVAMHAVMGHGGGRGSSR